MNARSCCRTCGATVRWVTLDSGRALPLDPHPTVRGNVRVDEATGRATVLDAEAMRSNTLSATPSPLYVAHFATCPDAATHRKGTR